MVVHRHDRRHPGSVRPRQQADHLRLDVRDPPIVPIVLGRVDEQQSDAGQVDCLDAVHEVQAAGAQAGLRIDLAVVVDVVVAGHDRNPNGQAGE